MTEFTVSVSVQPVIRTAGIKVRTTMARAQIDCPALWQRFVPTMCGVPANPDFAGKSYGVSVMVDAENFDYWAVMPIAEGAPVPEGMDILTLPGGLYAECAVPSLAELGNAFNYIYGQWAPAQDKYAMNMQGIGYELYTSDFMTNGSLAIYCSVTEK